MQRNYYLDLFRVFLTIFVLLYHLGLCEAGFLAVCGFFTISGYLLATSINQENFNLKAFYVKRLKSLYLPLLIVTFITVYVFRYLIDLPWVSIKQETLSVILGYNNFFQISANNNYFIRSDASAFTHMWYIAILMQVEFLLPLIIVFIRKSKYKFNKHHLLLLLLTILSAICFVLIDNQYGISVSYYHTLSRLFSFLIGYYIYYLDYSSSDNKKALIVLSLIVLIVLSGALANTYYVVLMITISILSGVFILLTKSLTYKKLNVVDYICKISYYVYLVQYPLIYIVNSLSNVDQASKIIFDLFLIVSFSTIFAYGTNKDKFVYKKAIKVAISLATIVGAFGYVTCPDYYLEMEQLKAQLETNQDILANRQAQYLARIGDKQASAISDIGEIDEALANLDETVRNTQVLLVGDSIMLGGSFNLDEYFDNYYCDAKGSRNGYLAYETLSSLLDMGVVGDYIVIHLGTNSGLELEEVESISSLLDDQRVFWLTVTNGWRSSMNPMLEEYCNTHENNYLVDWYNYSLGHKEYFIADGLHLSDDGRKIYDQFIFDNLKEVIKVDLQNKRQEMINEYNKENNDTVSFYGNDLLINLYEQLDDDYIYYANSDYDFDSLYEALKINKENLCLSKTVFIVLDKTVSLSEDEFKQLNELLNDNEVHIFAYGSDDNDLGLLLSDDCLLEDGIHLNTMGNKLLVEAIKKIIAQ